jgi:hypothetical protein
MENEIYKEYTQLILSDTPHSDACRKLSAEWGLDGNEAQEIVLSFFDLNSVTGEFYD